MTSSSDSRQRIQSVVSQFRNYDKAVHDWLASAPVMDDGRPVPVVVATPDRAFSAMNLLLRNKGDVTGDVQPKNIPLPFISLSPGSLTFDGSRYHGPVDITLGSTSDRKSNYYTSHPLPWNIAYRAEFWSKNMEPMNVLKLWWTSGYRQGYESFIPVDLSNVWPTWNRKLIPVSNDGLRFSGDAEPEEGHRVIRYTADFELKAWITPPVLEGKTVLKIITNIYLAKTNADLKSATGPIVDDNPAIFDLIDTQITE
jgi:hypothetical protein